MIALVTGANGCIGYALVRELLESGEYAEVRALVRDGSADLPPGVAATYVGDLDDREILRTAVVGVDAVFHCAAKVHDADGAAADFERVNMGGTQNLLDACDAMEVAPRFVHFSTVAVYGEATPAEGIDETAAVAPHSPYARSKVEAEKRVADWGAARGVAAINLRVATVYGPRDRGNMARMLDAMVRGRYLSIGGGQNRKTCANVRNVARVARLVGRDEAAAMAAARPFVVADPQVYTVAELEKSILRATAGIITDNEVTHRPAPSPRSLPLALAYALAWAIETLFRLIPGRRPPITTGQVRRLAADNVYRMKTLPHLPGWDAESAATLDEGMAEAMAWYRRQDSRQSKRQDMA